MIDNRIKCIQRQIDSVFPKSYDTRDIPIEDAKQIDEQIQTYFSNHPLTFVPHQINFDIGNIDIKKELKWYFETYD